MTGRHEFTFPVIDEMRDYVSSIVEEMARTFNISEAEALSIINDHWAFHEIGPDNLLGHEEPDYWARTIYGQYRWV
ncbi:hypothetical protein ACQEVZ_55945 [Dactylosporangium sp. CA-152071]|uniref:hypothetical protein n=1 Tax=Dactylosporangium sp. CA-152071 TaxID=3239933 RepID=UPI003D8D9B0F